MAIPKVLDARVIYEETCKAAFCYQEKITFLHLLIMILVRAKAWWIKNPTSPAWCGPHGVSPVMYSCTIIILHKQYYQQKTNHPGEATSASGNWRGRPKHHVEPCGHTPLILSLLNHCWSLVQTEIREYVTTNSIEVKQIPE